jgi:hypothetical protein
MSRGFRKNCCGNLDLEIFVGFYFGADLIAGQRLILGGACFYQINHFFLQLQTALADYICFFCAP